MQDPEHKFNELRFNNAMKLQTRMMELVELLRHDRVLEEENTCENEDDDDDWDDEDEENNPAHSELFTLMEVYRTISTRIVL